MPANSTQGQSEPILTGPPDRFSAWIASPDVSVPSWPCSYRIAGATSYWPAVEVYEAGTLLDVVSSTKLVASVLRGGRALRGASGQRAFAWGRLPLGGDLPVVVFSRGWRRIAAEPATPVPVTAWCWVATADGRYDSVTARHAGLVITRRLQDSRSCR